MGGGVASQPLNIQYGRSVRTAQITGLGTYKYDSLQTRLERRFNAGLQIGATYTFSKALGIAGNNNGDGLPAIQLPAYYNLNRARSSLDRTHNLQVNGIIQLPFGQGKKIASNRFASAVLGGWQLNALLSMYTGQPFNITAPGTSLNAPGNTQRADQIKPEVLKLGGIGSAQPFYDPAADRPQSRMNRAFFVSGSSGIVARILSM